MRTRFSLFDRGTPRIENQWVSDGQRRIVYNFVDNLCDLVKHHPRLSRIAPRVRATKSPVVEMPARLDGLQPCQAVRYKESAASEFSAVSSPRREMASQKLTTTDVANQLRDEILSGRLRPGHRLIELELSERFSVGRGRIREAIQQLARQGLLVIRANRGAVVASDAPKAIRDLIIPIRRTLEVYTLGLIFEELDEAAFQHWETILQRMRAACEHQDFHAIAEADIEFHRAIIERSGQPDLLVIWETLVGRIHSHFLQVQWRQSRILDIYDEHRLLLDTFRSGDREAAIQLLTAKID
jgi:DNA-binding GntR family transcriptional regulator